MTSALLTLSVERFTTVCRQSTAGQSGLSSRGPVSTVTCVRRSKHDENPVHFSFLFSSNVVCVCVCVCVCVISRSSVCFSSKTKPTPNQRLSIVETVRIVHRRWRCSRFVVLPFPLSVSILPLKCPRNPMCKFGISSTIGFVPIKTKVYCANISSQPS